MTSALFGYVNRVHISIVYPGDNYIHRQNVVLCDLSVISALRSDFTHDGSYGNRGLAKLPCSEPAVTPVSPLLQTNKQTTSGRNCPGRNYHATPRTKSGS